MPSKQSSAAELVSLMFSIGRAMREEGGRKANTKKGSEGSLLQFETLRYIRDHDRPLMRDVARFFVMTPPAATLLIEGLVKEKLLLRTYDNKDRRAVRIALTKKGKTLLENGIKRKIARFKKIFDVLSSEEKNTLAGILKKMAKGIA